MSILWVSSKAQCWERLANLFDACVVSIGPFLIVLATFLISSAAYIYFRWVLIHFHYPDPETRGIVFWIQVIIASYLLICVLFHYVMAIITKPGKVTAKDAEHWKRVEEEMQGTKMEEAHVESELEIVAHDTELLSKFSNDDIRRHQMGPMRFCKHCQLPKPARTHHCSVCNHCVLKMDHHCPWIANCVGHHNHRYFVLFLLYMSFGCYYFAAVTLTAFISCITTPITDMVIWPAPAVRSFLSLLWILATVIGLAICALAWWQWYLVKNAFTTIDYYKAMDEEEEFRKKRLPWSYRYDLGYHRNLAFFFNITRNRPWYTVLIPYPIPSPSDGTWYPTVKYPNFE